MSVKFVGADAPALSQDQSDRIQAFRFQSADITTAFFTDAEKDMGSALAGSAAISVLVEQIAVIFVGLERNGVAKPKADVEQRMLAAFRRCVAGHHEANRSSAS